LRSSLRALHALTRPFHHGLHRRLTHPWAPCRYPPAAMDHLSARPPWWTCIPVTAGPRAASSCSTTQIIRFEASFPLRSARLLDPASLLTGAAVLSWAFRPSRVCSTRPLDPLVDPPHPRSAARTAHDCSHTARESEDLATPLSGEPRPNTTACAVHPARLVGGHRSSVDRAVPPLRRQSFSRGLGITRRRPRARPDPRSFGVNG
jgi:hypothetical protein